MSKRKLVVAADSRVRESRLLLGVQGLGTSLPGKGRIAPVGQRPPGGTVTRSDSGQDLGVSPLQGFAALKYLGFGHFLGVFSHFFYSILSQRKLDRF